MCLPAVFLTVLLSDAPIIISPNVLPLIIGVFSIVSSLFTIAGIYYALKYRISLLERRLDLLESKDLPDFKTLIHSDLIDTKRLISDLSCIINSFVKEFEKLQLEFSIRVKENQSIIN